MSNSSKNTVNTNSSSEQVKPTDDTTASNSSSRTAKRSAEDVNVETKKTKIETSTVEQKLAMPSAATNVQPNFVSAATLVTPIPEISDEELLEFVLEYERKHDTQTMENFDGDFNPVFNNPLPPEFAHWSLDTYLDDDEFRAGYPFSPVQEMELNDSSESYSSLSTPDNNAFQSNTSCDNGCIETTKEKGQLNDSLSEQQEKKLNVLLVSRLMDERDKNHQINPRQEKSSNEEKIDGHPQHDIVDLVNNASTEKSERSDQVEVNGCVVLN